MQNPTTPEKKKLVIALNDGERRVELVVEVTDKEFEEYSKEENSGDAATFCLMTVWGMLNRFAESGDKQ